MPRFSGASRGFRTPCARKEMERAARGQLVCPWTVCGGRGCARARACVSVKRMRGAVDPASTDQPSTDRWLEMQSGSFGSNHGRSYGERRLVAHHLECLRWCVCARAVVWGLLSRPGSLRHPRKVSAPAASGCCPLCRSTLNCECLWEKASSWRPGRGGGMCVWCGALAACGGRARWSVLTFCRIGWRSRACAGPHARDQSG